jgi:hypothetical protein
MSQHIGCCDLSLTFGHRPVLNANVLSRVRIGPADDIAGGEDVRIAGLKPGVDEHAAVDRQPGLFCEVNARFDARTDDYDIGFDRLAVLLDHSPLFDALNLGADTEAHPLPKMGVDNEIG